MSFSLYISLVLVGWLMIYTVGHGEGYPQSRSEFLFETAVGKQSIWILISLISLLIVLAIDSKFWKTFAYPVYVLGVLSLAAVLIFGSTIKGATSWFILPGGFSLQPSEFAKIATALALAAFISTYSTDIRQFQAQAISVGLIAFPIILILLQPDAGSALVFLAFFIVLFREGMPAFPYFIGFVLFALFLSTLGFNYSSTLLGFLLMILFALVSNLKQVNIYHFLGLAIISAVLISLLYFNYVFTALAIGFLFLLALSSYHYFNRQPRLGVMAAIGGLLGGLFIMGVNYSFYNILKPHQQDRINVWLNPEKCDPQGSLYNVLQSKLAIGSGGVYGKGFLQGTLTKLNYIPEQSTDFIFCTIGEEQGLVGSLAIIALFIVFILRLITLAERQKGDFSRIFIYGVASILFLHVFVNIGMTMGLVPIIGIPLPFISYGGSSLLAFSIMIGLVLKFDSQRYVV